jgi:hypothetical protein
VKEAFPPVQHVVNGVCRKITIEKRFIAVLVEQLLDSNSNPNMLLPFRYTVAVMKNRTVYLGYSE